MNEDSVTKLLREIYSIQCRYQDCEDVFENQPITPYDTPSPLMTLRSLQNYEN